MTLIESPLASTIVDSFANGVGPQSMYRSTVSPSWACASSAVTGVVPPWRFALVVVIGPNAFVIAWATEWSGTRIPRSPVEETRGTGASFPARRRIVTGPGRCFAMIPCATGVTCAYLGIWSVVVRARAIGWSAGRRFTSNTRSTASISYGSHPRPYAVSVGYTISFPASSPSQTLSYSSLDSPQRPAFVRPLIVRIEFDGPSGGPDLTIWRRVSRHRSPAATGAGNPESRTHGVQSRMPSSETENTASASGRFGESIRRAIRFPPFDFRR